MVCSRGEKERGRESEEGRVRERGRERERDRVKARGQERHTCSDCSDWAVERWSDRDEEIRKHAGLQCKV